jgi:hypothetical protein
VFKVLLISLALVLSGCTALDSNYAKYIDAKSVVAAARASKPQEPIMRLKACSGCVIKLEGVEEFSVYAPIQGNVATSNDGIEQKRDSEVTAVVKALAPVLGTVLGIRETGKAVTNIIGASRGTTTTTYTDSNNTGSYNTATESYNTPTTTTTDSHDTTTTTSTDSNDTTTTTTSNDSVNDSNNPVTNPVP